MILPCIPLASIRYLFPSSSPNTPIPNCTSFSFPSNIESIHKILCTHKHSTEERCSHFHKLYNKKGTCHAITPLFFNPPRPQHIHTTRNTRTKTHVVNHLKITTMYHVLQSEKTYRLCLLFFIFLFILFKKIHERLY